MFDIGWTEMVVLGVIALLVLGPKELPGMLKTIGRFVGRFRDVANDFRRQMDDISDEIDAREQLKKLVDKNSDILPDLFEDGKKPHWMPDDEDVMGKPDKPSDTTSEKASDKALKAKGENKNG